MTAPTFDPATLTQAASDTLTVRRVFGEAYEHGGTTVIPVARVWGATGSGAGGGSGARHRGHGVSTAGSDEEPAAGGGHGGGGWYGTHVRAVGVFVVDESGARWQPALDLNRVILGGQLVGAVVLTVGALAWAIRRR
jgi:uncharacterized spore protein YtfJ